MTEESKAIIERLRKEIEDRKVFRSELSEGSTLTWIMNECGCFDTTPETIKPELIALANRLRNKLGIVHPGNLFNLVEAELTAANDIDLLQAITETEAGEAKEGE